MKNLATIKKIILGLTILVATTSCDITDYILTDNGTVVSKTTGTAVDNTTITTTQNNAVDKGGVLPWKW